MTIYAKLLASESDSMGYITYVFEKLEVTNLIESPYVMMTRFPNWNCRKINVGERGFVEFVEIRAGVDKWFDGQNMIPYNYNNIQFLKFITKPDPVHNEFKMLINLKLIV